MVIYSLGDRYTCTHTHTHMDKGNFKKPGACRPSLLHALLRNKIPGQHIHPLYNMYITNDTVWRETLVAEKFGELIAKTYLAKENLANFVHSQIKNYENYVIRRNSSINV